MTIELNGDCMIFKDTFEQKAPYFGKMAEFYLADEQETVTHLQSAIKSTEEQQKRVESRALALAKYVRDQHKESTGIDAFLAQYSLSSQEGAVLMCLAESLLRIPDADTQEKLIRDKLGSAHFEKYAGKSDSTFVNFSTWALMFSGKVVSWHKDKSLNPFNILKKLVNKTGEPVIRQASLQGVKLMGKQFVLGETIEEAQKRGAEMEKLGYRYSYDMLGEAAKTMTDAEKYFKAYHDALTQIIATATPNQKLPERNGLSIKLSALHPRYEFAQRERVLAELYDKVHQLCVIAAAGNINLTIDAEESDRLELSLEILDKLSASSELKNWQGLGLAVQAYQKRAPAVLDFIIELGKRDQRRFMLRLVKGAYWDSEIKWAQERGHKSYPVFTRKSSTDLSYAYCVQKMLAHAQEIYPQFATHNAQTVAWILENTKTNDYEFQRLHGMGDELYQKIVEEGHNVRIYAPVGEHADLLSYLVRRLLENGANTSFVNRMANDDISLEEMIEDPLLKTERLSEYAHPKLRLPYNLYDNRQNSRGVNLSDPAELSVLQKEMKLPVFTPDEGDEERFNPATGEVIGRLRHHTADDVNNMLEKAYQHYVAWDKLGGEARAILLEKVADTLEAHKPQLLAYLCHEAGKTLADGVAELREAADFCRYYAMLARKHFSAPLVMEGPTGEANHLSLHGRGVFVCISPWNFPLAIFTGQIAAALAAGNAVVAKPAAQTPLVAKFAIHLFHQAGIPKDVLHLAIGSGRVVGEQLIKHPKIAGVAFTGSTDTAWHINQTLATKKGPIIPFIAETGGQNCMVVDSSALPEQVVTDVIASAFQSAGQRCSALRVLFIQDDIADKTLAMLKGAMQELNINDPAYLSTDIGPVIDRSSQKTLEDHINFLNQHGKLIYQCEMSHGLKGSFFAPAAYEISSITLLEKEVFGPILHVIRYKSKDLQKRVEDINSTGFGLTFGVHSRITQVSDYLRDVIHAGNVYVNRNMIGAVVGVQPFGGEGLSGTGPKAGGPYTLFRYACERTYTVNTSAIGGNTSLVMLEE